MRKFAAALLILASLAFTGMQAHAFSRGGPADSPGPDGFMGLPGDIDTMTMPGMNKACRTPEFYLKKARRLDLTPEQLDRMETLYFELKRTMLEKGARVKVLELELTELVRKTDFDLEDAKSAMEKVERARTDLRSTVLEAAAAARDILTPEQLDQVRAMRLSPVNDRPYRKTGGVSKDGKRGSMPDEDSIRRNMERKMRERMGAPEGTPGGMYDDPDDDPDDED